VLFVEKNLITSFSVPFIVLSLWDWCIGTTFTQMCPGSYWVRWNNAK